MGLKSIAAMMSLLVLALAYGNCQKKENGENDVSSLDATCEGALKETFKASYYPWLRSKCASCHFSGADGIIGKGFGDKNTTVAFKDFFGLGEPRVRTMALDPEHQSGLTGTQNSGIISTARSSWELGKIKFDSCVLARNGGQPPPPPVNTIGKLIARPATIKLNNPNRAGCKNAAGVVQPACILGSVATDFVRMTWNLGTDLMPDANNPNLAGVTFDIEVGVADYSPDLPTAGKNYFYYHFRNPRLTNNSGSNILVSGFMLKLNGETYFDGTTFTMLNQTVNAGVNLFLLNNQTMAMGGNFLIVPGSDLVSFMFSGIGPTTLTGTVTPTFTSLFGPAGTVRGACVACHLNGTANAGALAAFNMSTFAGVSAKVTPGNAAVSRVILRMESLITAPTANQSVMPPAPNARVSQTEIDKVKAWINAGAQNN